MEMYEISAIMKYQYLAIKESWEQTRYLCYIIAQCNSKKKLKPSDIISFQWEKEEKEADTAISNQDIKRLKKKAQEYLNK